MSNQNNKCSITLGLTVCPLCVMWDEKVTELRKIISEDDAEQIIGEVKAKANPYLIQIAIERMETIVQILLQGIPVDKLMPHIKNQQEQRVLRMLEASFAKHEKRGANDN